MSKFFGQIKNFVERQTENFKVLLISSVLNAANRELVTGRGQGGAQESAGASYLQLYLRNLGADAQQIGFLNTLAQLARLAVGLPLGWISDRISLKKVVVFGYLLCCVGPLLFAFATTWPQAIPAMMINQVSGTIVGMFVAQFFVTSTRETSDRATAMSMRSTLISVVGLAIPTIAAIVVLNFGGISVEGIRPLFIIEVGVGFLIVIFAQLKLKEVGFLQKKNATKRSVFQDYKEIASLPEVQKWTFFKGLRGFFTTSLTPFFSIYYVEVKGANVVTIAAIATVATFVAMLTLVPLGRIADKRGRKWVIYLTRPFHYVGLLLLILAPPNVPEYLIAAAVLGALQTVSNLMEITMEWELVPDDQRGRLAGFLSFFMGLIGIPGPIMMGFLWERVNPSYLLLLPILTDIPFLVFLTTLPDTLHKVYPRKNPSS
ncbi:MAG: MFS transporter [Candidatus Bathyarchaeota archaeon]